jgi:hypothetical protein
MHVRTVTTLCLLLHACWAHAQIPPTPQPEGANATPQPRLIVSERSIDLGRIIEGDMAQAIWTLQNQGDAELVIERTQAGCGCTVVQLDEDQKRIPPGESIALKAEFNSQGRRGEQSKPVTVYSNDPVEPELILTLRADVRWLIELRPSSGVVHLRSVRRGDESGQTLDVLPGDETPGVEVLGFTLAEGAPIRAANGPFHDDRVRKDGTQFKFTALEDAPLGRIEASGLLRLKVGEKELERTITFTGQIVGELHYGPTVVDMTRIASRRGQTLRPVRIYSTSRSPFEITSAEGDGPVTVSIEPAPNKPEGTEFIARPAIRDDAAPGPFGAMVRLRTSSLDQPLIEIPVFGVVAPVVEIDPPLVMLRDDGTRLGTERRIKLQTLVQQSMAFKEASCSDPRVEVTVEHDPETGYRHIVYLRAKLVGQPPAPGNHEASIVVTTGIEGAERLEIPIVISTPGK